MMSRVLSWLGRYGWIAYWLLFVAYTLSAAREPGLLGPNAKDVPYPWRSALLTCAVLGLQTAALNATLRPLASTRSWQHVAIAFGLAVFFAALSAAPVVTDMPGYYYTPIVFALTNVVAVPLVGAILVLRRNSRSSAS